MDKINFTIVYNDGTTESVSALGHDYSYAEKVKSQIESKDTEFVEIIDHFYRKDALRKIVVDDIDKVD